MKSRWLCLPFSWGFVLALALGIATDAASEVLRVDNVRSTVGFHVQKLLVHRVHGTFERFSADIRVLDGTRDFERAVVSAVIETASVKTDDAARDHRLREKDFFWCDAHPEMTFRSSRIRRVGPNRFTMTGELTIRGVTRPVLLDVERRDGEDGARFRATGTINRFDFGLAFDRGEPDGLLGRLIPLIGSEVTIVVDVALASGPR